jgi:fatty acid desaturase
MLWTEAGPLDIFLRARAKLATNQKRRGGLFDLVSCFFCLSIWVSMVFALFISANPLIFTLNTLILSGIASLIHEIIGIIKGKKNEAPAP